MTEPTLPDDVEYVRTTPRFTRDSVPGGLLATHRVAAATWGVLTVHAGTVRFVFDDQPDERLLQTGNAQVIPPLRPHHVVVDDAASFDIAFYRDPPSS